MNQPLNDLIKSNVELKQRLARCQRGEQALLVTKHRLQRLLASSPAVIYSSQPASDYGIIFVSESIQQFGYQPQDFLENIGLWKQCIHPEDLSHVLTELHQLIVTGQRVFEYRFRHRNGEYYWIQDQRIVIYGETHLPIEIIGSWQNISERKAIEQALFHEKEIAQNILQSIGDGVITTDAAGLIQYMNPTAEQMIGCSLDSAKQRPLPQIVQQVEQEGKPSLSHLITTAKTSGKVVVLPPDSVLIAQSGAHYAINGSVAPIRDRNNLVIGAVIVFRDITQHYTLARQLSWHASHDFLTGLVNRREFEQELTLAITSAREQAMQHTLCYLDLDQFKVVNDTCGHGAGDELLRQLSALLLQRLRTTDVLARIGGDEFGILLHDCALENATSITDHLLQLIRGFRFVWHNNVFTVGASAGLVAIDTNCGDLNSVLGAADAACFAAKSRGRNRFHIYQTDDRELAQQRGERQWVARILKALEDNRFCLYKQAIAPIAPSDGKSTHYELLIRMVTEDGEPIPPMAFIPAAERYGLMPTLDRWVISTFFAHYDQYTRTGRLDATGSDRIYAINLSGVSVNDEQLPHFLKEQFLLHNVLPQTICFEITETAAISNLARAAELIQEIKALGCSFALDDFGSGMSSFAYLKTLPVDYVKIDGSFIRNITRDSVDSTMVECMTRIGHELGIQTIAEFVENDAILNKLRELGVDYAQGYEIGVPEHLVMAISPNLLSR